MEGAAIVILLLVILIICPVIAFGWEELRRHRKRISLLQINSGIQLPPVINHHEMRAAAGIETPANSSTKLDVIIEEDSDRYSPPPPYHLAVCMDEMEMT